MNLFDSLKVGFIYQRIFLIFPFYFNNRKLKNSYILSAISLMIMGYSSYTCFIDYMFGWYNDLMLTNVQGTVSVVITKLEIGLTILCFIISVLYMNYYQQQQIDLLNTMEEIDHDILRNLNANINYNRFQILICVRICIILVYHLFMEMSTIILFFDGIIWYKVVEYFLIFSFSSGANGMIAFSFLTYIHLTKIRIVIIKNELKEIISKNQMTQKFRETNERIIVIFRTYKKLCRGIDLMNTIYGYPGLMLITHDFILVASQWYFLEWMLRSGQNTNITNPKEIGFFVILWMIPNILKFGIICLFCHCTINELKEFERLFMWLNRNESRSFHGERAELVEHFQMRRLHFRSQFTMKWFFSIDARLIMTVCERFFPKYMNQLIELINFCLLKDDFRNV